MKKPLHIYLAGPDVFRSEEKIKETSSSLKQVCASYGHLGHFPLDNLLQPADGNFQSQEFSFTIFRANIQLIDEADAVIANLENFRGPNVDDGTAFEIGYAFAKKKVIYGYSPTAGLSYKQLHDRFLQGIGEDYRNSLQKDFPVVEDFEGNTANLMLIGAIAGSGGKVFGSFEECVKDLNERYS